MTELSVTPIDRLDLALVPRAWPFAIECRSEIARHFEALKQAKPGLWNGRTLLLHDHSLADGEFRGAYLETDFASYVAWRDWGFPDASVKNCFGMGALRAADGAFLLGVMSPQTVNAGKIYFPAGVLDPTDVVGGAVDLAGNVMREVAEETGIAAGDVVAENGWHSVFAGPRIAMIKVLHAREPAAALRSRILTRLAQEPEPELADIRVVRGPADLDPMMPPFVATFLTDAWSREHP